MTQPWESLSLVFTVLHQLNQSQAHVGSRSSSLHLLGVSSKILEEHVGVDITKWLFLESTICHNIQHYFQGKHNILQLGRQYHIVNMEQGFLS